MAVARSERREATPHVLRGETLAALGASCREDVAAGFGFHALTKAVLTGMNFLLGLVCHQHDDLTPDHILRFYSLSIVYERFPPVNPGFQG